MSFLNIFSKKKEKSQNNANENDIVIGNKLEKKLSENNIEYINEDDYIIYNNFANRQIYKFLCDEEYVYFDNNEISIETAYELINKEWQNDKKIIPFLNNEDYLDFFELEEFCYEFCQNLKIKELVTASSKTLKMFFQFGDDVSEQNFFVSIECYGKRDSKSLFKINPLVSSDYISENEALTYFIQKAQENNPLIIENGSFKIKEDSKFTDLAKSYLMSYGLVNRLNQIINCEAKLIEQGKSNAIFVILDNNSALEYLSPTVQNPNGQLTVFDVDDEAKVEDSQNFVHVTEILNLSTLIKDLPNEENMPQRTSSISRNFYEKFNRKREG